MGLFNKGLPLLSCFGAQRAQRLLPEECNGVTPWHQQPDIVSLVLRRLPTAEVLPKERVCRAWKYARVMLQTDVNLNISKKVCKWQHAWLKHNIDRIGGALTVQEKAVSELKVHMLLFCVVVSSMCVEYCAQVLQGASS